jgi:hypothetical protein
MTPVNASPGARGTLGRHPFGPAAMTDPPADSPGSLVPVPAKAASPALPFRLDRTPVRSLRRWLASSRRRRC